MITDTDPTLTYQIEVEGHLDHRWHTWFDTFDIAHTANGRSRLTGPIEDQAALHGVLRKINNLGLKLISLNPQINQLGDET